MQRFRYQWAVRGDINGFFALAIDNLALLVGMSGILVGVFGMPSNIVLEKMVPGTALGVLAGDLLYTWLAFRLAHREMRQDVCAMPLGIDTPSMFALCFGVIGPAYRATHDSQQAWAIGMSVLVIMGTAKIVVAFAGDWLRRTLPSTSLLAAISAVAVLLIMFLPFTKIIQEPIGGFVALGVILLTLVGRVSLPGRIPAVVASVIAGWGAIWIARHFGYVPPVPPAGTGHLGIFIATPTFAWFHAIPQAVTFLPLAIPVALTTVVGGIDVTESAALAGDRYVTRSILVIEGFATLLAGMCGGVIQNTPYIGHPAYKSMGSRAAYTLATGLFIGIGAATGLIGILIGWLPESIVMPILVFVGLEMSAQAAQTAPASHLKAISIGALPVIAALIQLKLGTLLSDVGLSMETLPTSSREAMQAITMLGNGFIVSSMLWSAWLVGIIEGRLFFAAGLAAIGGALTLCGLIHSPFPDGRLFWPGSTTPAPVFALAAGYALLALLCASLAGYSQRAAK